MSPALWLDVGVVLGALLALLLMANGVRHVRRRHGVRGTIHGLSGLVVGCLAAIAMLVGVNLLTYARFTAEQPVATISFQELGPQRYDVTLVRHDGDIVRTTLKGDEWELDARIIKWKGFATLIGFKPLFRLQRLSGRYTHIGSEISRPPTAISLANDPGVNLWELAHKESGWLPLVDAAYGTATYLPMSDGAVYRVSMSVTGLVARPVNTAARKAVQNWD
ncbi:MAG TPA: cation/multidrug efflux pump [Gammaproteobacteria bacterium]|nr:cation/multidrug efflux pump [Gammaproteobacteria bacterium]